MLVEELLRGTLIAKSPCGLVCAPASEDAIAPSDEGFWLASISAPAIGAPAVVVNLPTISCERP
jgi:hypothetical protein